MSVQNNPVSHTTTTIIKPKTPSSDPPSLKPVSIVSTPVKSGPPSGLDQRKSEVDSQKQLTSDSVPLEVSKKASDLPATQIDSNASEHQDLFTSLQELSPSVVSSSVSTDISLSPRHFSVIENLAKEGKSPEEIAKHLKDADKMPGPTGAERYKGLSEEALASKIAETPHFGRGQMLHTQAKRAKDPDFRGPTMRAAERLPAEVAALEKQLKDPSLTTEKRAELQVKLDKAIANVQKFADMQDKVGPSPTRTAMLHRDDNVFQKLYKQATPKLPQEIAQMKGELSKLNQDIGRLMAVLPEDLMDVSGDIKGIIKQAEDNVATVKAEVDKVANPLRSEIEQLKTQASKIADPTARAAFVKTKLAPKAEALEKALKPLHQATLTASFWNKTGQALGLLDRLNKKEHTFALSTKITTLEGKRQELLTRIETARNAIPTATTPLDSMIQQNANQFELDAATKALAKVDHELHELREEVGHGGMEWGRVKKEFLETDRREFFMKAVIDFRQEFVLTTYKEVVADLKKAEVGKLTADLTTLKAASPQNPTAIAAKEAEIKKVTESWDKIDKRAAGSTDLTSDIDMTVLADRAGMDTAVMREVNRRFQEKYGSEAGNLFDVNLYVAGGGPAIKAEVKSGPKVWANPTAKAAHDRGQDISALVKQRLYSTPEGWAKFVGAVETGLRAKLEAIRPALSADDINAKVKEQSDRFAVADQLYQERHDAIGVKMEELLKNPDNHGKSHYDLELIAMNRLFEDKSDAADVIKKEWESMPSGTQEEKALKDAKWAEYTEADSRAQLFANEPYFSEGPVRHVVGNEQALKGLKLGSDGRYAIKPDTIDGKVQTLQIDISQAMESVSENLGDSKKELNHLAKEGKGMGEIAIKASKYMGRLTRAIEYALPKSEQSETMKETIKNLQNAEVELLRIRKGGQLPDSFKGTVEEYALEVMQKNGLGHLLTDDPPTVLSNGTTVPGMKGGVAKLQKCFEDLTLEAEIAIRTKMVLPPMPVPSSVSH